MNLERIVKVSGAYDKRHSDPKKNYGIHGMELRFVLKGPAGAVQFLVFTNMNLPHVHDELAAKPDFGRFSKPMGADVGYHAREPQYEGHRCLGPCEYLDGAPCYYDGSTLRADDFMPEFLAWGSDAVWLMLEQEYAARFGTP